MVGSVGQRWLRPVSVGKLVACAYTLAFASLVYHHGGQHLRLELHRNFPTGYNLLAFDGSDFVMYHVNLFVATPILYAIAPTLTTVVAGVGGNQIMRTVAFICLAVGWMLHLAERFALDTLCYPTSPYWFQPTGYFHVLTGIAIWLSYINTRFMDMQVAEKHAQSTHKDK